MKISARDIDHLSLTLTEPEAAANRLLQLGFNLTPEGVEPRCICFQPDQDEGDDGPRSPGPSGQPRGVHGRQGMR